MPDVRTVHYLIIFVIKLHAASHLICVWWIAHLIFAEVCTTLTFIPGHFVFVWSSLRRDWHITHIRRWYVCVAATTVPHAQTVALAIIGSRLPVSALNSEPISLSLIATHVGLSVRTWMRVHHWSFYRLRSHEAHLIIL